MKKILSFLIILGAITFINFDVFAYTFNGSYDFSNIDLNVSLSELNGASLNDLFDYDYLETIPLIEWNGYRNKYELDNNGNITFNEYIYIDLGYKNLFREQSFVNRVSNNANREVNFINNKIEYITYNPPTATEGIDILLEVGEIYTFSVKNQTGNYNDFLVQLWHNGGVIYLGPNGTHTFIAQTDNIYIALITQNNAGIVNTSFNLQLERGNLSTSYIPYNTLTEIYKIHSTPIENTDLVQSLYLYNLENMNIDLLNYYFAVFLLNKYNLPVGDLWSYAYTAGLEHGYNDGYSDGLFDYHTGNSYGQYDYTLSEPYDQATQANISLLSVFSMIIGVVMSMLGFIINIEMFGISIASILGTLAIGVSIIWLLKLIRG